MAVTEVEAMCNPNFGLNQRPGRLRRTIIVFAGLTAVAIAAVRPAAAADAVSRADMAPDALVQSVSTEVLDAIRSDPALHKGDVERLQKLIDDKVAPYVDFERMTRLSVGRGWRTATPEQRQALMREFRTLLVRTYSGALSRVTDHQVKMRPFRAQPTDTDVVVRSLVAPSAGEPIQLDYRLEKTDNGWKIYDVTVDAISIVANYRNQFNRVINDKGFDVLMADLKAKQQELASLLGARN